MKRDTRKKRITWKKVARTERITLHQNAADPTIFSVRWKRSDNTYGNRRFSAVSKERAVEEAPVVAGLVVRKRQEEVRIVDAFNEVLSQTKRGEKSRHDWNYYVKRFMRWLAENHREVVFWHLLTRQIVREYLATFDGRSATMRRLALQPICQTSGYMHREHGFVNCAERLGIGSKLQRTPPMVYIEDVMHFCDFLRERNPRLQVGVCLQGLAGLQLQEATRLTWDKVNLDGGLVEVSGDVKNQYRNRVIPVCKRALESLRRAFWARPEGKVQIVTESVLVSPKGFPYGKAWHNYSKEVRTAIREWNPGLDWQPKDLRNCLPTFATMSGMQNDVWEQYLGHAPRSVTARHYIPRLTSVSVGEENAFRQQMEVFRFHVVSQIDQAIESIRAGKILNFFEHTTLKPTDAFKIAGK